MSDEKLLWSDSRDRIYSSLLEETKDIWDKESDEELLLKIADHLAEYNYKKEKAELENNENAARIYKHAIEYATSDLAIEIESRSNKFEKKGITLLNKTINAVAKKVLMGYLSDSLERIPKEERESVEKGISEVFDNVLKGKPELSREKIMAEIDVSKVESKLESILEKLSDKDANYFQITFEGVTYLMTLVHDVSEMTGDEKKEFCIKLFKSVYKRFDPDLPWIDGQLENAVEVYLLDELLPAAIEAVYAAGKNGLFQKD